MGFVDPLLQNGRSLKAMLWGRGLGLGTEYDGISSAAQNMLDGGRAKYFVDPYTWIDFLSKKDFSCGTRIHGNITALLGGTPSFVLATDSRTRELCEFFDIPYQRLNTIGSHADIEYFRQKADYTKLLSNYGSHFDNYINFLEKNGLPNCFSDSSGSGSWFEEKLGNTKFPKPASGVNSGFSLKYRYKLAKLERRIRKKLSI